MIEYRIKNRYVFAYLAALSFMLYILQSTKGVFPVIYGGRCVVLVPLVIYSGMLFKNYIGTFLGLFAGMLMDINTNGFICFNAIVLMLIGCASWLLVNCYLNKNFLTAVIINLLFTSIYFLIKWALIVVFDYSTGIHGQFITFYLPSMIYTSLIGILVYFLLKFILKKMSLTQH